MASRVPTYEQDLAARQKAERDRIANMSSWERALNGAQTGYNEGSKYGGMWGGWGGAIGGAIDGYAEGPIYEAHVERGDTVAQGGGTGNPFANSGGGAGGGAGGAYRSAFGYVPEAAQYQEVPLEKQDYGAIQQQTINDNIASNQQIWRLLRENADINQDTSRNRADGFSPALWGNVGTTSNLANQYLNGQASWSDSMETVARSTGINGSVGTPGTGAALTARDLGLLDMDLRQRGVALNGAAIQQAEQLDPRGNYGTPQEYQLTPRETVPWKIDENLKLSSLAIQQAENQYASDQNANNLWASPDPMAKGMFEKDLALQLAKAGGGSGGSGGMGGMDWGALMGGMGSMFGGMGGSGGSTGLNTGGQYANVNSPYKDTTSVRNLSASYGG